MCNDTLKLTLQLKNWHQWLHGPIVSHRKTVLHNGQDSCEFKRRPTIGRGTIPFQTQPFLMIAIQVTHKQERGTHTAAIAVSKHL